MKRLDHKLASILADPSGSKDFIIADAKDADMAFGLSAPGPMTKGSCRRSHDSGCGCFKTLADYHSQIREVIEQNIVDIMLLSASSLEKLSIDEGLFGKSDITPAARANDTTDIWAVRGGSYSSHPSLPFRTATIDHIKYGKIEKDHSKPHVGADLGLYSLTFTNHIDHDRAALQAFNEFRAEAEQKHFRYFLEVFNPNVDPGFDPSKLGHFLNDCIVRCLAGVTRAGRPQFLKIPYNGPGPLEELVSYDESLIVGILGGAAGTTMDAFQLIHDARRYGARAALFGRKINRSEHPLSFIRYLRLIADQEIAPSEAVRAYHGEIQKAGIQPNQDLKADLELTQANRY